jgi:outer membrane protein assembly factor BamB
LTALTAAGCSDTSASDWTQWGGPHQDFEAASKGLATEWPDGGPPELWSRELGDGYSGILHERGKLYTMYRVGEEEEAVVVLDAKTGETVWEHRYAMMPEEGHVSQFGDGPRATPLIDGDRIYTIGIAGRMHCLNKKDGSVLWTTDLWGEELGGNILQHGYSSSPIVYGETVITLVGGEGASVVAFDRNTGEVRWKTADAFENSYSTPRILSVDGEEQLVAFMRQNVIGLSPSTGELKWSVEHEGANVSMPVMLDAQNLFVSSPGAGAKGLKITNKEDGTSEVEVVWSTRKIQFYHVTTIRNGDWIYGSTGTGPCFMAALNMRTGEIGWRERGIPKANVAGADGKVFILDEEGKLYLATASPEGLDIHSQAEILDEVAWTLPTIIGKTLYARDTKKIVALDLGA